MRTLGPLLRDMRKARGFTQVDLADLADVTDAFIANVENGKRGINPDVLERLIVGMKLDDGQGDALRLARLVDGGRPPASNPVDAELASLKAEVALAPSSSQTPPAPSPQQATASLEVRH